MTAVHIDGDWRTKGLTHYTATGTNGEKIELRRSRPESHHDAPWVLKVTTTKSVVMPCCGSFDHAEAALLKWGDTPALTGDPAAVGTPPAGPEGKDEAASDRNLDRSKTW